MTSMNNLYFIFIGAVEIYPYFIPL